MIYSLAQTNDKGFVLAGFILNPEKNGGRAINLWLVKTDSTGVTEWSKTLVRGTFEGSCEGFSVVQAVDGGYAIAGTVGSTRSWLVKVDSSGNKQWDKIYESSGPNNEAHCIIRTNDGGYALAGYSRYYYLESSGMTKLGDFSLIKTGSNGESSIEASPFRGATSILSNFAIIMFSLIAVVVITVVVVLLVVILKRRRKTPAT